MPANFRLAGLIHLALPNARIIHTCRDPVDTCLSCFSTLFAADQPFAYDLGELGRYYRAYSSLMEHWRRVLPEGVMLDVQYEELVADFEPQARRIVAHCGLAWDDACLAYDKAARPIKTASSAQVHQSIYRSRSGAGGPMRMCSGPCSTGSGRIWPAHVWADRIDPTGPLVSRARQLDDEPVIAGLDAWRQFGAKLAIIETLIHVRQHRSPRTHPGDPGQRLGEIGVGRMRLAAQAVDDPQINAFEHGERAVVELGDICRIGEGLQCECPMLCCTRRPCANGTTTMPWISNWPTISCGTKVGL